MNNLEKYLDQVIEQKPVIYDSAPESEAPASPSLMQAAARRWPIVVLVFVLVCVVALPMIWFLIEPRYVVTGALHVVPSQRSILTGEPDRGEITDYPSYMNTQAARIMSTPVLTRVADDLADRGLVFFREDSSGLISRLKRMMKLGPVTRNPVDILKAAVNDGTISASPVPRTEYLSVTVRSTDSDEARLIAQSIMDRFRNIYGTDSLSGTNSTLDKLYDEQDSLGKTIKQQHDEIIRRAREYGAAVLDSRHEMEMQQQTALWTELTRVEARKISVEATIAAAEQAGDSNTAPEQLMASRKEYINADSMVQELTKNIVQMERDLLIAQQNLAQGNPELERRTKLLEVFKQNLAKKEEEVGSDFEAQVANRRQVANQQRIAGLKAELDQISLYEQRLREALSQQDTMTRQVGQANVDLQDMQYEVRTNQEIYDQITRRIKNIEMEKQRELRIQPAYAADVASIEDKRVKYSAAVMFLALGCGFTLAVVRDRTDKTLQTPEDVTRQLDLPIIGTTTSSRTIKAARFAEHLAGDYQTIRTNLSLLTTGGMPKRLTVSSAGEREGKTTFAVNLATSLAKGGRKVLLVDGDLRKPDIAHMLSILNGSSGLQDVLMGGNPAEAIHVMPSTGLHVLVASQRNPADSYELLTSIGAAEQIEKLGRQYDHLIVDTPPALVFPDALVWAKLTDAVVLVGYAGQTRVPDLKEAKERFARIRARVLGAVLSNVPADRSPYRTSYSYRPVGAQTKYKTRVAKKALLLTHGQETGVGASPAADIDRKPV
jgi:succinoglycan biosynthesis transport protein ExoP